MNKYAKENFIYDLKCLRQQYYSSVDRIDRMLRLHFYNGSKDYLEKMIENIDIKQECAEELDKLISLYESKE
jgi:hypothetical protein